MAQTYRRPSVAAVTSAGVLGIGAYVGLLAWMMQNTSYDAWGTLVVLPALLALSAPLLRRVAAADEDRWVAQLLWIALVVKLLAGIARWYVAFVIYNGNDAGAYAEVGVQLAALYRDGVLTVETPKGSTGTGFMMIATGVLYAIIGPTFVGAFLVFSWLGFWGLVFLYRAFRICLPDSDHRRYAILLLFMPSLVFWPSSIGKEAWILFWLGLGTYGAARLLRAGGANLPALGMLAAAAVGMGVVRPHFSLLLFAGLVVAWLLRPTPRRTAATPVVWVSVVAVLAAVGAVLLAQTTEFLGIESTGTAAIGEAIESTGERTDEGGSAFTPRPVHGPQDVPMAAFTVLFRPTLLEASGLTALIAAAESTALLVLMAASWPRLRRVPAMVRTHPYVAFCCAYVLSFVIAFSAFGNFGLLARQRALVYPFVLVLLCLPHVRRLGRRPTSRPTAPEVSRR